MAISKSRGQIGNIPTKSALDSTCGVVVDVILNTDHPDYNVDGEQIVGCCRLRLMPGDDRKPDADCNWYPPLNATDLDIPLVGELVHVVTAASKQTLVHPRATRKYYTKSIAIYGETHNNNSGESTGPEGSTKISPVLGEYTQELIHHPHQALEGDKLILGRYGQSIRFTNAAPSGKIGHYWSEGRDGDPVLILSTGTDPSQEGPVEDLKLGSHIVLSNGVKLQGDSHSSHQILLKSEKVTLNSKEWRADLTELVNVVETVTNNLSDLLAGSSQLVTGTGPTGPAVQPNVIQELQQAVQTLQGLKE